MENAITPQLEVLLKRLGEAERRAKLLKLEVKSIQRDISTLQSSVSTSNGINIAPVALSTRKTRRSAILLESPPSTNVVDGPSTSKKPRDETDWSESNNFKYEDGYVIAYTDGACENNGKPNAKAGIGVWFGENNPLNISKPVEGRPTNNTAEIQACIQALLTIKQQGLKKVKILTDSQFTISCMTSWIKNWKKNQWKTVSGGPVKNKEDLQKLDAITKNFTDIQWVHVAGHKGIRGNEEADKLARQGALQYRRVL